MARPPLVPPGPELTPAERTRFARHLLLPDLGLEGQRRLRNARVLVVGAGGLGSPALLYLGAAGVGTIGVVDDDVVETTNLQRQVVHGVADVGRPKVDSAADAVTAIAPDATLVRHAERLDALTAMELLADYDLVLDGADNFPTRYLIGDACARLGIPHVWGSVFRFDGQVSVWWAGEGPCYACVFPRQPAPEAVPSCAVGGVLGAVCASVGSVMATEAVKLVTGVGEPLVGRLLVHDALAQTWDTVPVRPDPSCAVCGASADLARPLGWATAREEERPVPAGTGEARPAVGVAELARLLRARREGRETFDLLDVREPGERDVAAIPGSVPGPIAAVRAGAPLPVAADRVYVYCKSGGRSAEAVDVLRSRGVDAVDVLGGVLAWAREVDPSVPTY
ncbi:molybdopterin-synthase adenylyltransferase MoeB [Phycicoccus endophyticus]|uniref:Molybdopterin-synthase adenylyltransferase MoeB n=1 Tax=Phycicoccus endophyticus TaxID=1690220 RepID=A0A7G9QYU2_9MICO|nr:molybdopterin-synthase adenylyltransferase MoeB [Phycicoccus endophyticus]NHI20438.1 molybdopterin-synthase adenylyltransferase MoeB [Phycicoccus endophyticus]QNN48517.1 molybdopterin-synthase adenylyltransferase MoeB [Phycicoccus endophyticus]GGL30787.1 adenylyltransferase/sulfurtransferase MoeZ [Phycicoccus endophyticus]